MLKYISFDLDGTLTDDTFDNMIWWEEIPKLYAKKNKIALKEAKIKVYAKYYKSLYIEKVSMWTDIAYWFDKLKLDDWEKLVNNTKQYIVIYKDTIETLKYLHKKYNLIIVSDANKKFLDLKIESKNIKEYFDHIFSTPSNFGIPQKNETVFQNILEKLKIKSNEIIHIGDNRYLDYIIPSNIGIKSYHLIRSKKMNQPHTLHSLVELKDKL